MDLATSLKQLILGAYRLHYTPEAKDEHYTIRSIAPPTAFTHAYELKPKDASLAVIIHAYFILSNHETISHHFLGNLISRLAGDLKDEVFVFHGYLDHRKIGTGYIAGLPDSGNGDGNTGGGGGDVDPPLPDPTVYPFPYYGHEPLYYSGEAFSGRLAGSNDQYIYYGNPNSGQGHAEIYRVRADAGMDGIHTTLYHGQSPDELAPGLWYTPYYPQGARITGTNVRQPTKVCTYDTNGARFSESVNTLRVKPVGDLGIAFMSAASPKIQRWLESEPDSWLDMAIQELPVAPLPGRLYNGNGQPAFAVIADPMVEETVSQGDYDNAAQFEHKGMHILFPWRDGGDPEDPDRVVLGHAQVIYTRYVTDNGKRVPNPDGQLGWVMLPTQPVYQGMDGDYAEVLWDGWRNLKRSILDMEIFHIPGVYTPYQLYLKEAWEDSENAEFDTIKVHVNGIRFGMSADTAEWHIDYGNMEYNGRVRIYVSSDIGFDPYKTTSGTASPADSYPRQVSHVQWLNARQHSAEQMLHLAMHWRPVFDSYNCLFNWLDSDGTPVMIHRDPSNHIRPCVSKIDSDALAQVLEYVADAPESFDDSNAVADWFQFMPTLRKRAMDAPYMRRAVWYNSARRVLVVLGHQSQRDLVIKNVNRVSWVGQSTIAYQLTDGTFKFLGIRLDEVPVAPPPNPTPQA